MLHGIFGSKVAQSCKGCVMLLCTWRLVALVLGRRGGGGGLSQQGRDELLLLRLSPGDLSRHLLLPRLLTRVGQELQLCVAQQLLDALLIDRTGDGGGQLMQLHLQGHNNKSESISLEVTQDCSIGAGG